MSEQNSINCLLYGGFGVAFFCLLLATIARKIRVFKWLCFIGAFLGLVYEGGCMMVLGGIGTATGGSSDATAKMMAPVWLAFFIASAWCVVLVFLDACDKNKSESRNSRQNDSLSDSENNDNQKDRP